MNNRSYRKSKRQFEKHVLKMNASLRTLIAVVAIIECLLLVVFTTYSWIETNSSLIIMNGPSSNVEVMNTSLSIANELNYKIDLDKDSSAWSDLNSYFSSVKYFEFAKTTSPDGKTFFFPRKNNTHSDSIYYRPGDTDDYNTSYLYFDFVLSNRAQNAENYDIYFDEEFSDIFTVTGDFTDSNGHTADEYRNALKSAMRMSITAKTGNTEVPRIYSGSGASYNSIPPSFKNKSNATTANLTQPVNPEELSDYVYRVEDDIITSEKLFVAKKNYDTEVSIRIWFEENDPTFKSVFGYGNGNYFTSDVYKSIPNAKVGVKFKLKASANDLRALYFDDYTLSNAANAAHITDENPNYSVWFYAYQPYVGANTEHPERPATWVAIELTPDRSNSEYTRWFTSNTTVSMMEYMMGCNNDTDYSTTSTNGGGYTGTVANRYQMSYFCYGDFSTKRAIYRWALPSAPEENADYTFNAYSYDPNSSVSSNAWSNTSTNTTATPINCNSPSGGTFKNGVGLWQDDSAYTSMKLLKFSDLTTGVTTGAYNASVTGSPNMQFMNAKAETVHHSYYLVYANNKNYSTFTDNALTTISLGDSTKTLWGSSYTQYSATHGEITETNAVMYYDDEEEVFKSYVPAFWLTGDANGNSKGVSFTYTPTGAFTASATTQKWYSNSCYENNEEYIYTALGYTNPYNNNCYVTEYGNGNSAYFTGVGTWGDVEKISFCTDLIDGDLSANYRYMIGISGYSASNAAWDYYVMVPDETNMTFSAYIPRPATKIGSSGGQISFARYNSTSTHSPAAYWYANSRNNHSTFYPVDLTDTTYRTSNYNFTHGYWNLSVLVDGTYENLIFSTLTDGSGNSYPSSFTVATDADKATIDYSGRDNYGTLEYSYDGEDWQDAVTIMNDLNNTTNNCIDRYRFYAPAESNSVVYWRWTPYAGYTITVTDPDPDTVITVDDTVFIYEHDTASGIYKLVTEAQNQVNMSAPTEPPEEEPSP